MKKWILIGAIYAFPSLFYSQNYSQLLQEFIRDKYTREYPIDFDIELIEDSQSLKGTLIKIQQKKQNTPIFNAYATALVKGEKVVHFADNLIKTSGALNSELHITKEEAFEKILISKQINEKYVIVEFNSTKDSEENSVVHYRNVFFMDSGMLKLSYEYHFFDKKSSNHWNIIVDAKSGEILYEHNLTLRCNFHEIAHQKKYFKNQNSNKYRNEKKTFNSNYTVFALPIESPIFGNRSSVINPWDVNSSPLGWHSDGIYEYTNTRGNNVFAYEDRNAVNSPGFSPDGGSTKNFNFPLDFTKSNLENVSAAITNLFYVNNKIHDIFYRYGFTENARNFQKNNWTKGGIGNDELYAESQDLSEQNNSTFSTPPDGSNPRMQMFLWTPNHLQRMFYQQPLSAISRQPNSRNAEFGPLLTSQSITGEVKISPILDACNILPDGSLFGKIGMAERGNCNFTEKVKNMQQAGALAAIVYNAYNSTNFTAMGGTDTSITIPSILIENSEGEFIKNSITNGESIIVTLKEDQSNIQYYDASFDNGVIIHEYGHGITNRLTGTGYSCLNKSISAEQMGEGWSDFFSLVLTHNNSTLPSKERSIAAYLSGENSNGNGIRPTKYSPDFSINNFTYGKTNGMEILNDDGKIVPNVHSIGFIWATMLWDIYWKYVEKYGYSDDISLNTKSGNSRFLQTVINGLKLQECNPTFVSGRDAIIAADISMTNGENRCLLWEGFANRGLGIQAASGYKNNINDQKEDFTLPTECVNPKLALENEIKLYPNPAKENYYISFPTSAFGKVIIETYDSIGRFIKSEERLVVHMRQEFSVEGLTKGVYHLKIKWSDKENTLKLLIK